MRLFVFLISFAVESYQILGEKNTSYSFKDVCTKMGVKNILMVDKIDDQHLDCMGKSVFVNDFCATLGSGVIKGEIISDKVKCTRGDNLFLSVACNDLAKDCQAHQLCLSLKKQYAVNLDLNYAAVTEDDAKEKLLNCYYVRSQ